MQSVSSINLTEWLAIPTYFSQGDNPSQGKWLRKHTWWGSGWFDSNPL